MSLLTFDNGPGIVDKKADRTNQSKRYNLGRTIEHIVHAVEVAESHNEPFHYLQLADIFREGLYAAMLDAMPLTEDYRQMWGRTKSTRTVDGGGTRTKIDLFPEYIRHLPAEKKRLWEVIDRALCSKPVREAFKQRLAPGLKQRFGPGYARVGMYPIPILTRDIPGYSIGIPSGHALEGDDDPPLRAARQLDRARRYGPS